MIARAALLALLLASCGPTNGMPDAARPCPTTVPDCPTPMPSYASTIGPLMHERCVTCHFPGTTIAPLDLSTYAEVHAHQGVILGQVFVCNMPKAPSPPLTDAERDELLAWLQCGAPNN